ncbi:MAG: hypothetical protein J2P23_09090, partial [Microlunatus sp.]|nr:hypothetical protein [Microlunatus sp.]
MTASGDMATILEDLAAGRIDAAEAARRIDALSATHADVTPETGPAEPQTAGSAAESPDAQAEPKAEAEGEPEAGTGAGSGADEGLPHPDAWSASTDRPQTPGQPRESFGDPSSAGNSGTEA